MTAAAWVQAIATLALILVTAWYVYHTWRIAQRTSEAADAARESAEAAKEMVRLERSRLVQSRRPQVRVAIHQTDDYGEYDAEARCRVLLKNEGDQDALRLRVFLRTEGPTGPQDREAEVRYALEPDGGASADFGMLGPGHNRLSMIAMSHYTDQYHNSPDPRVYHSLCLIALHPDGRVKDHVRSNFTPEHPMEEDPDFCQYLSLCKACQERQAESHHEPSDV